MKGFMSIAAVVIGVVAFALAEEQTSVGVVCTIPVWNAISNRWLTGEDGSARQLARDMKGFLPVTVERITNSVLSSWGPIKDIYRVGVLRVKGDGKFLMRDFATVTVDGKDVHTIIGTDDDAVDFINRLRNGDVYSMKRVVEDVATFCELRLYTIATEDILDQVANVVRPGTAGEHLSQWSLSIRNGKNNNLVEVTVAVDLNLDEHRIRLVRYFFKYTSDGWLAVLKKENAGSVGGYL